MHIERRLRCQTMTPVMIALPAEVFTSESSAGLTGGSGTGQVRVVISLCLSGGDTNVWRKKLMDRKCVVFRRHPFTISYLCNIYLLKLFPQ
uniref:Uncharacterized protein n=1 Tax=Knipowitschia caucasica TaxID=637954 RepID=A0AAV2IZA8_KNICA